MQWWNEYVGRQWHPTEWNCWHVVTAAYKEQAGIELPGYSDVPGNQLLAIAKQMREVSNIDYWVPAVCEKRELDLVLMSGKIEGVAGAHPVHCGVVVGNKQLLHAMTGCETVCIPIDHFTVKWRIVSVYRHRDLMQYKP